MCARGLLVRGLLNYLKQSTDVWVCCVSLPVFDLNLSKVWGGRKRKEDPGNVNA